MITCLVLKNNWQQRDWRKTKKVKFTSDNKLYWLVFLHIHISIIHFPLIHIKQDSQLCHQTFLSCQLFFHLSQQFSKPFFFFPGLYSTFIPIFSLWICLLFYMVSISFQLFTFGPWTYMQICFHFCSSTLRNWWPSLCLWPLCFNLYLWL